MNKELSQIYFQELEDLQIKISKELSNRQLSSKSKELEKIKQKFSGKYFKYATGIATHVGYIKSITSGYDGYGITIFYAGFTLGTYGDTGMSISSCSCTLCNVDDFMKIQCITKDEIKEIFKEYLGDLNKCFEDKVLSKVKN